MYDLFHDGLLYDEFLTYSKAIFSEENIYLMRAIYIFRQIFDCEDIDILVSGKVPLEAEEMAWKIFRFFIAPGSAFGVSGLSEISRKDIILKLVHPEADMFVTVEKSMYQLVRDQYTSFSFTNEFTELPSKLLGGVLHRRLETHNKERVTSQSLK
jgi:hypothetical protein